MSVVTNSRNPAVKSLTLLAPVDFLKDFLADLLVSLQISINQSSVSVVDLLDVQVEIVTISAFELNSSLVVRPAEVRLRGADSAQPFSDLLALLQDAVELLSFSGTLCSNDLLGARHSRSFFNISIASILSFAKCFDGYIFVIPETLHPNQVFDSVLRTFVLIPHVLDIAVRKLIVLGIVVDVQTLGSLIMWLRQAL